MRNNHSLYLRPILFIAFFIGIALSVLAEEKDILSKGANISNMALGLIGLGTLLLTCVEFYSVRTSREVAKTERTFKLLQDTMIRSDPIGVDFLTDKSKSIDEKLAIYNTNSELRGKVVEYLNKFEHLSIFYNTTNMLDTKLIKHTCSSIIISNFSNAKWLIEYKRANSNDETLYKDWELLVDKLSKNDSNKIIWVNRIIQVNGGEW